MIDRRQLLGQSALLAAAAAISGGAQAAAPARPDWFAGVGDLTQDVAPQALARLHGRAPADLAGTLYRNGPARFRQGGTAVGHWFDGDGMIRAWKIADGKAELRARFVDTVKRRTDTAAGAMVQPGFKTQARPGALVGSADDTNAANTSVIVAGGQLLALWEAGSAYALDADTLATKGPVTFRPDLAGMPFLAHPRIEPDGRIWNLGMGGKMAFVWRLSKAGVLEAGQSIPLPMASYAHDFTATARHLVIVLQPWIKERNVLPFAHSLAWRPELGTKVLVIDKDDLSKRRVFELPPLFFFHLGDAWEETDGTICFDGCFDNDPGFASDGASALIEGRYLRTERPALRMVSLRPDGRASLDDAGITAEFPRSDPSLAGLRRTRTVHVGGYGAGRPFARSIGTWDWQTGKDDAHDFGSRQLVEEFVPVGRWLIGTTLNLDAGATELHVMDSRRVADGPVVSWRSNVAMPLSFHGNWLAA
ncbi:carotenoid oxygenase family protein [Sandarakinorhabdus sp.]|uniref:carotenoid oxygenase family protein n=1 Tax=Sandarakinorhabdus sp. TaxID=1916663 RepID=UPI00286DE920|nr:carotenoid oxygenase family protein [Sandarakinorhabdus sp.]